MYNDLASFLSQFSKIPSEEWVVFEKSLQTLKRTRDSYLFHQGDMVEGISWIRRGLVATAWTNASGRERIKGFVWERMLVAPLAAILTERPSSFSVKVLEDSEFIVIPYQSLKLFYERHSCWQEIGRKLTESAFIERERRLSQMMLKNLEERYRDFQAEFQPILPRIPQYMVASYIGVTPEALSRLRASSVRGRD